MIPAGDENIMGIPKKIQSELKRLGVTIVYLFGSAAEGKTMPQSDLDLGVVLEKPTAGRQRSKLYLKLYDLFTDLFPGKNLDIVFLQQASLELRFDAISHGQILFASDPEAAARFEDLTILLYVDFQPILREFNQAVLSRI